MAGEELTPGRAAVVLARVPLLARIPVWAWLAGLVVLSTGIRYALGRRLVAPWIMVDELIYSELAKGFAATGRFLIRDQSSAAYGLIYPAIIAPAWAAFSAIPDAYAAAKGINALAMSLAAIPAYLLARRVLGQWSALAVAVLTVAVPSMLYTGVLMTENAFYPLFLCAALALVAYLEAPGWKRALPVLAVAALCYFTRAQAVALLPAILTAPLLHGFYERRSLRSTIFSAHRFLYGLVAAGVLLVVVAQVGRGRSVLGVLGAYKAATDSNYSAGEVLRWLLRHVAELDLYLGVIPFAALLLIALQGRSLPPRVRAFTAAAVTLTFWLVLLVSAFASQPSVVRVEERNMFYVAPLFFVALLLCVGRDFVRSRRAALVAAAVAAALPGLIPFEKLIGVPAISDTLALIPWWRLQDHLVSLGDIAYIVAACAVVAAAIFLLVPRRYALVLPLLVVAYFAAVHQPIESSAHGIRMASLGSLFQGQTTGVRDWIDRKVGRDADVAALWSGNTSVFVIWQNEFFNRSVGSVYNLGPATPGGLVETTLKVDGRSGLLRSPDGRAVSHRYVLTDTSLELAGTVIARDVKKGVVLVRLDGPMRSTTKVVGLYANDTWSGRTVTYTRLGCTGGSVTAQLRNDPALRETPVTVTATVAGREVGRVSIAVRKPGALRAPLVPRGDACVVTFTVSPVTVPAVATDGANPDPRELGVHFDRFDFAPAPRDAA